MVPCDATRATFSLGSKIYCLLGVSRRLMCLDTDHLEIGWEEIPTRIKNSRISPMTVVANGKLYVMDGNNFDPWAEVFDPCNGSWNPISWPFLSSPNERRILPGRNSGIFYNNPILGEDQSYIATALALDDDGTGVSRKVILLASRSAPSVFVYDLMAKCWIDPPPKLSLNFFYRFGHVVLQCQPVVVGKTVYWFAKYNEFYAYDLELGQCFYSGYPQLTWPNWASVVLLHLGGERFCMLGAECEHLHLFKIRLSKGVTEDRHSHRCYDLDISLEGEWGYCSSPSIVLLGAMAFDGKLRDLLQGELGNIVTDLRPSSEEDKLRPSWYTLLPNPVARHSQVLDELDGDLVGYA